MNIASILMDMLQGNAYGLNWVGKNEAILSSMIPPTTALKEDLSHNSLPENMHSQNLLISGDNLEVLKHLQQDYSGKIKLIYIDPPYNTGNKFLYKDKFGTKKDRHSAWLTFMYPRLLLARNLLRDDGLICVSIDENAKSQLMLLMADIFGEINFLGTLIRKTRTASSDSKRGINIQHEDTIVFAKDRNNIGISSLHTLQFTENKYMNQQGTRDLLKLGMLSYFSYPKPTSFLYDLIGYCTSKDDLILDFFAGSGSLGDAVMQINAEDGGSRKFILVQIPEPIDSKHNPQAYDFVMMDLKATPTIFEITKERLIRASKKLAHTLCNQDQDISFKVLKIE